MLRERLLALATAVVISAGCNNIKSTPVPQPTAVATSNRSILTVTAQPYFKSYRDNIDRLDKESVFLRKLSSN